VSDDRVRPARQPRPAAWWLPQAIHVAAAITSGFPHEGHWVGNTWVLAFLASLVSGIMLWRRGHRRIAAAALALPFVVLALQITLGWGSLKIGIG